MLVVVTQLVNTSCSPKIYHEPVRQTPEKRTDNNISGTKKLTVPGDNQADNKKLQKFLATGTGKAIDIKNATPDEIITTARQYLGVPHCMGGTNKKCIDCSGLLVAVFAKYGIYLPHNSQEQARFGKKIVRTDQLRRGDLVFFIRSYKTSNYITHDGIYLGDNKFIHTSASKGVTITSMDDPYWRDKFVFGTRVFR